MCGLFGFSGWDKGNLAKLKILGSYNQSRGRDSCGYFYNGNLVKGVDKVKEWNTFMETEVIEDKGGDGRLFIGHTRSSTVGGNTAGNAHPFNINDRWILAHNGTIDNIWSLCNLHGVDSSKIYVDSLALGHLIDAVGFKILEEYRGYAALLMHRASEPGSLYVYHGASRKEASDNLPFEERPLFYMKTREGVYFSSLRNSLMAIRDSANQQPEIVDYNRVIKLTNGKFGKAKAVIHREDVNIGLEKKTYPVAIPPKNSGETTHWPKRTATTNKETSLGGKMATSIMGINAPKVILPANQQGSIIDFNGDIKDVWNETLPPRCFNKSFGEFDYLYYHKGRHYHIDDRHLANGVLFLDKAGTIYDVPGTKIWARYFFRGVMLKDKEAYDQLLQCISKKDPVGLACHYHDTYNFAQCVSKFAMYPVTNLENEFVNGIDVTRKSWWFDLKAAKGSQKPVWADRNYVFSNGNLVNIIPEDPKDITMIPVGGDEWANHKIYAVENPNETVIKKEGFMEGEIIEPVTDNTGNTKKKQTEQSIQSLARYFDRVFTSLDEMFADVPTAVFVAINYYVKELLLEGSYVPDRQELDGYVQEFLNVAISDGVTLRDNMDEGFPNPEEYLRKALADELNDEPDGDDEPSETSELHQRFMQQIKASQEKRMPDDTVDFVDFIDVTPINDALAQEIMDNEEVKKNETGKQGEKEQRQRSSMQSGAAPFKERSVGEYPPPVKVEQGKVIPMTDLNTYINNQMEKELSDEEAAEQMATRMITAIGYLYRRIPSLTTMSNSPFAIDLAWKLGKGLDKLNEEVQSSTRRFNKDRLTALLEKNNIKG